MCVPERTEGVPMMAKYQWKIDACYMIGIRLCFFKTKDEFQACGWAIPWHHGQIQARKWMNTLRRLLTRRGGVQRMNLCATQVSENFVRHLQLISELGISMNQSSLPKRNTWTFSNSTMCWFGKASYLCSAKLHRWPKCECPDPTLAIFQCSLG